VSRGELGDDGIDFWPVTVRAQDRDWALVRVTDYEHEFDAAMRAATEVCELDCHGYFLPMTMIWPPMWPRYS
jgi:hypothetical protein